jgi:hypothetical protein
LVVSGQTRVNPPSFGVLSPRALAKINSLRNKLEHEYASPDESDLEIYFELVSAFVHAVEGFIPMLQTYGEMTFATDSDYTRATLTARFIPKQPCIQFECQRTKDDSFLLESAIVDGGAWGRAVRAFFLLCRYVRLVNADFVLNRLEPVAASRSIGNEHEDDA